MVVVGQLLWRVVLALGCPRPGLKADGHWHSAAGSVRPWPLFWWAAGLPERRHVRGWKFRRGWTLRSCRGRRIRKQMVLDTVDGRLEMMVGGQLLVTVGEWVL